MEIYCLGLNVSRSFTLSAHCPIMGLSHLLQEESSLMMAGLDTDLFVQQNVISSHFIPTILQQNSSSWFSSRKTKMAYLVSGSWSPQQYWAWIQSYGMGLISNQIFVNCSYNFCATIVGGSSLQLTGFVAGLTFTFLLWQCAKPFQYHEDYSVGVKALGGQPTLLHCVQ